MISDGIWAALAVIHPSVQDKSGPNFVKKHDIISVRKCTTKLITKNKQQYPIIVFLDPINIIYTNLSERIGRPKEFSLDTSEDS